MPYSPAHPDADSLRKPLLWSLAFHLLLLGSLFISTMFSHRGELWGGGGGGAVTISLVGQVSGVPLPRPEVVTTSRVVDATKGLYQSEPKPKIEPKDIETQAKLVPQFQRNKPQRIVSRPSRLLENPTPPPTNAIPYGQGGAPAVPYTQFTLGGSGTQGAMGFSGPGGGEFGGRFPWYVDAVRNRISSNWLQSTIDPSIRWAPRCVVTFQILRNGNIVNIQVTRSSGFRMVDDSAVRAILSSNPAAPLPGQYSGSYVTVEFWFDFRR